MTLCDVIVLALGCDPDHTAHAVPWPDRAPGPGCAARWRTRDATSLLAWWGCRSWRWDLNSWIGLSWIWLLSAFQGVVRSVTNYRWLTRRLSLVNGA